MTENIIKNHENLLLNSGLKEALMIEPDLETLNCKSSIIIVMTELGKPYRFEADFFTCVPAALHVLAVALLWHA